jgi:carbamoyltransferase
LLPVRGELYSGFATAFDPFRPDPAWDEQRRHDFHLSIPGKVMAYAGLGEADEELIEVMRGCLAQAVASADAARAFTAAFLERRRGHDDASADVLASFQVFVGRLLVAALRNACSGRPQVPRGLCIAGGCALNIKWNGALRASGMFESVWVPPFPNDSGSAVGSACAELLARGHAGRLEWSVYCGPRLGRSIALAGWTAQPCSIEELAAALDGGAPVVTLLGRAEAGPRALGHRSILADPRSAAMKDHLNAIKGREAYRPVAPICLERDAPAIFDPGAPDAHMLFDHRVRDEWAARIPAVLHLDGTARLQTIAERDCAVVARLLEAFRARTGLPVLCNTSANLPGRGFFPDAAAAMRWGEVDRVWAEGTLYIRSPQRDAGGGSR